MSQPFPTLCLLVLLGGAIVLINMILLLLKCQEYSRFVVAQSGGGGSETNQDTFNLMIQHISVRQLQGHKVHLRRLPTSDLIC